MQQTQQQLQAPAPFRSARACAHKSCSPAKHAPSEVAQQLSVLKLAARNGSLKSWCTCARGESAMATCACATLTIQMRCRWSGACRAAAAQRQEHKESKKAFCYAYYKTLRYISLNKKSLYERRERANGRWPLRSSGAGRARRSATSAPQRATLPIEQRNT